MSDLKRERADFEAVQVLYNVPGQCNRCQHRGSYHTFGRCWHQAPNGPGGVGVTCECLGWSP